MRDHTFCQLYLKEVMKDVRKHTTAEFRKYAWTWKTNIGNLFEFHIHKDRALGKGFYWYGQCHCKWDCRAKGWEAWMRENVEGYDD